MLLLALALAAVSAPAGARPCETVRVPPQRVEREVRRLRRAGYLVKVERQGQPAEVVSDGAILFPPSLARARRAISGCR